MFLNSPVSPNIEHGKVTGKMIVSATRQRGKSTMLKIVSSTHALLRIYGSAYISAVIRVPE
jgi:hypothetical protein